LLSSLETVDTAIELGVIAEERATAEALKVRIIAIHQRVVAMLAPAVPFVSAPPESGGLLPLAAPARLPMVSRRGGRPSGLSRARGIESEGRK
jgi:hypothetical protein